MHMWNRIEFDLFIIKLRFEFYFTETVFWFKFIINLVLAIIYILYCFGTIFTIIQ